MGSQADWLFLFLKAVPCSYRCKHCDFAVGKPFKTTSIDRLYYYLDPFVAARDSKDSPYTNLAVHLGDCALNHPDLDVWGRYMREHDIEGWYSIPADGFRHQHMDKWRTDLEKIREAGTEILEFTLYGLDATHDSFVGVKGSYAAIHNLAKLWQELGGQTMWGVVAHQQNIGELEQVKTYVLNEYQQECPAWLWGYIGHGAQIEDLRLEEADLESFSPAVREELGGLKSERGWIERLRDDPEPPFPAQPRIVHAAVDEDGSVRIPYTPPAAGHNGMLCAQFPTASVLQFYVNWTRAYLAWQGKFPALKHLSRKYGEVTCSRLYDKTSVIRKWCSRFEAESI